MTAEVDRARVFVHVEFYITAWDEVTAPFFEALVRAAERGVAVRLLFDHLGSRGIPGYKEFVARLEATGHRVAPDAADPARSRASGAARTCATTARSWWSTGGSPSRGSQNLIEPGYNKPKNHKAGREWVELMARVEGPVVHRAQRRSSRPTGTPRPARSSSVPRTVDRGTGRGRRGSARWSRADRASPTENNLRLFTTLIYSAQRRLSITSPYFVPDESLLYAVTTAAQRGVEVELFVSEAGDQFMVFHAQRSYYEALLRAGVRIYLYPAPFVLHSKFFTVDDDVAVIGSSNMDMRSFALNYEVSLMLLGADVVRRVRAGRGHLPRAVDASSRSRTGRRGPRRSRTSTT